VIVYGKQIISGSSDSTIRRWDVETGKSIQVIEGHKRGVEDLKIWENFLLSGSSDGKIIKWNLETGEQLAVLESHLTSIYCLAVHDGYLFSGSADKTVKKWDLSTDSCDSTFEHLDWVKSVLIRFPYLIVGGKQEDISVWNLSTEELKLTIRGHFDEVSCLIHLSGSKILSGGLDGTIRTWDLNDDPVVLEKSIDNIAEEEQVQKIEEVPTSLKGQLTEEEEAELAALMGED